MSEQQIQKVKVKRLARVGLWVTDVSALARFYYQVLGLDLRATSEVVADQELDMGDANMFLGLAEEPYCLGLFNDVRPTPGNGRKPVQRSPLHHLTFEVDTAAEMAALAARLKLSGIDFTFGAGDGMPESNDGFGSLWFSDPEGNRVEIAVTPEEIPLSSQVSARMRPVSRPLSIQHVALYTQQLETLVEFYTEALGFDISDWLLRERAWLRCNSNHHTLLLIQGTPGIEHIGYTLSNGTELLRWADQLSNHQVPILWGPGRHGAGNDLFLRFADPEGFHIELSAEMQQYHDRDVTIPPRLWHTRTMALNLWGIMPAWLHEEVKV